MGIKTATGWFSELCLVKRTLAQLRGDIIGERGASGDYLPIIAVDVSVWIRAALGNPRKDSIVSSEYHAIPPVPVMSVVDYVLKRTAILKRAKFEVILVFDGQRNPLKQEENDSRLARLGLVANKERLQTMYANPQSHTLADVLDIRKKLLYPRRDITYEVKEAARRSGIYVAFSPFETDDQMVALQAQDLLDAAISTDTDLIAKGVRRTIATLSLEGALDVRHYGKLTKEVLPQKFDVDHPIVGTNLQFLCNMLGNDNLPGGLHGSGEKDVIRRMKEYLAAPTLSEKYRYIQEYCESHNNSLKFAHSMASWEHSPAYKIIPGDGQPNARSAFLAGEFHVKLCSMSLDESYSFEPADGKIGYIPEEALRHGHTASGPHPPTHIDFFTGACWSRDGQPLVPVEAQTNKQGEEVIPGGIIHFGEVPIKFIASRCLETWLACRGVPTPSLETRQELEEMVALARRYEVDALPKMVMRSGGGCVTASVMEFGNESDAIWLEGEDAVRELRSLKCASVEDSSVLEEIFKLQHDSKRDRCLSHLKGGSFDLKDVKVSSNLKSELMPGQQLFVISFMCAPSLRGLGSENKLYPARLVFHIQQNGSAVLLPAPFSFCHCPVGIGLCAHKGGFLLLLAAIRRYFKHCDFGGLVRRIPPNIHSVASQSFLLRQVYPPPDSVDYALDCVVAGGDGYVSDDSGVDDVDGSGAVDSAPRYNLRSNSSTNEDDADDLTLERLNQSQANGSSNSTQKNLHSELKKWSAEIESRLDATGASHKVNVDVGKSESEKSARPETDPGYLKRRDIRWKRLRRSVQQGRSPESMLSFFCEDYVGRRLGGNEEDIDDLSHHIKYNDESIYPTGQRDNEGNANQN